MFIDFLDTIFSVLAQLAGAQVVTAGFSVGALIGAE
jgi:hypothetical protein